MNILVIAPHADDEVLGVGATMAKHAKNGDKVYVLISTNASLGAPELFNSENIEIVRSEALAAHQILGVEKTFFLDLPAPALNAYPSYKISLAMSAVFSQIKPDLLYLPHPGDLHEDHKAIYRASLVCARPQGDYSVKDILCYETLSETDWTPYIGDFGFRPNYFNDVSEELEIKLKAMDCFKSQLKEFPHSRSLKGLKSLAETRGSSVGIKACEAFQIERIIND